MQKQSAGDGGMVMRVPTPKAQGDSASAKLDAAVREMLMELGCEVAATARVEDLEIDPSVVSALSLNTWNSAWPSRGFNSWHDARIEWPCLKLAEELTLPCMRIEKASTRLIRKRGWQNFLPVHVDGVSISETLLYLLRHRPSSDRYIRERGLCGTWTFWASKNSSGTQVLDLSPARLAAVGLCCAVVPPEMDVPAGSQQCTGGCSNFPALWSSRGCLSPAFLTALKLLEGRCGPQSDVWEAWLARVKTLVGVDGAKWIAEGVRLAFPPVLFVGNENEVLLWAAGMPHAGGRGPRGSATLKAAATDGNFPSRDVVGKQKKHGGVKPLILRAATTACRRLRSPSRDGATLTKRSRLKR
jgi:hypothetical protein